MDAVAIARPYAAAAFQYARAQNTIDSWHRVLSHMAQALLAVQAVAAAGKLVADAQAAAAALAAADAGGDVDDGQRRFLSLLEENGRVFALPGIAARFDTLRMEDAGIVAVRVESAMPIDKKAKADFDKHLQQRLGKKVDATYEENSELLGGVRVYVDDDVIDASIRGRLDKLAATLTTQKLDIVPPPPQPQEEPKGVVFVYYQMPDGTHVTDWIDRYTPAGGRGYVTSADRACVYSMPEEALSIAKAELSRGGFGDFPFVKTGVELFYPDSDFIDANTRGYSSHAPDSPKEQENIALKGMVFFYQLQNGQQRKQWVQEFSRSAKLTRKANRSQAKVYSTPEEALEIAKKLLNHPDFPEIVRAGIELGEF